MPRKFTNYNWKEIQSFYDSGKTLKEVYQKFGCSYKSCKKAQENNLFKTRDKREQQINRTKKTNLKRLEEIKFLYHEKNYSLRDLYKKGFEYHECKKAKELGYLNTRSLSQSRTIAIKKYGNNVMGEESRQRLSERQSLKNTGGKCKWYTVSGQKLQGSWERDLAIKFEELGIKWYKPRLHKDVISYNYDGKTRSYTPDFYLEDYNLYLEVKGYWWGNDRKKMECVIKQNPDKRILIIEKDEYKRLLEGELVW